MARKTRLTALVVNSDDDAPPVRFLIAVEADAKFSLVSSLIQQRYKENYSAGRRADYFFKKIQDGAGSDIDLRDTVDDLFGDIEDPAKRVVQMVSMPIDRQDTLPPDSFLRPQRPPLSPAQLEEVDRRRSERDRYGSAINELDPDHPIDSHETPPASAPSLPVSSVPAPSIPIPRRDTDGFAIPAKISRPTPMKKRSHALSNTSQSSYEDHLVSSPFQTPERPSGTQYSTLEAVPSAQKPPAQQDDASSTHRRAPTPELEEDPIQDSEHEQTRLSRSRSNRATSNTHEAERNKAAFTWSSDEYNILLDLLARKIPIQTIHQVHMPKRTLESIKKKSWRAHKQDSASIEERAKALAPWTDEEESWFVNAIRNDKDWRSLHDHRFRHRSNESVKLHFAEVRRRLEAEDQLKSSQDRHHEQVRRGEPSTGPDDKFTQDEDDVILLSRIEGADMKGIAKEKFPLRSPKQVIKRASTLYNHAKRDWQKKDPSASQRQRSPSVEILFAHDVSTRDRIVGKKAEVQSLKRKISTNRTEGFAEASHHKDKLARDRARTEERRVKEKHQVQTLNILEKVKAEDEKIKRRRLNDDLGRASRYKKELAAWELQAKVDEEAGRPIQPRPELPRGSSIGTEVTITKPSSSQDTTTQPNKPAVNTHNTRSSQAKSTPSSSSNVNKEPQTVKDTALPGSNVKSQVSQSGVNQKRKPVEVQVFIPAKKKQKTDPPEVPSPRKTTSAKENILSGSTSKSSYSTVKNKIAQATRVEADQHSNTVRDPATQPTNASKKAVPSPHPVAISSPIAGPSRIFKHGLFRQNLRQSTLETFVSDLGSEKQRTSPANAPAPRPDMDDSAFITDSESDFGHDGITDEELSAAAERSEAMYSSSLAGAAIDEQEDRVTELEHPEEDAEFTSLMKSSPPVARSTPKASFSQKPFAPTTVQAETRTFPSTMPARRVEMLFDDPSPQTRAKSLPSPVISKKSEILGSDPSTPRNQTWTYVDHDIDMIDVQAQLPASLNDCEVNATAGEAMDEIPESSNAYYESVCSQRPMSLSDRMREVEAEYETFQKELSSSMQRSSGTREDAHIISSDESSSEYESSKDEGETTAATIRAVQTINQPEPEVSAQTLRQAPMTDEVEDINVWRSQSGHSDEEEDMPSEASEEMLFPRSDRGLQSFGPFMYAPEVQNRSSSVAREDTSPGTQKKGPNPRPVTDAQPLFPSSASGKATTSTTPKMTNRRQSCSTGSNQTSEGKLARRGKGRYFKRDNRRKSFELAADPPNLTTSTASAVGHTRGSTKKDGKKPVSDNGKATAGPSLKASAKKDVKKGAEKDGKKHIPHKATTGPSQKASARKAAKKDGEKPAPSKATAGSSEKTSVTKPAKKSPPAKQVAEPSVTPSSKQWAKQPVTQSNGRIVAASGSESDDKVMKGAVPGSESGEDSNEESGDGGEGEDRRVGARSPVFVHDQFLWPTENLQNMTEEEILNARLRNGLEVRRRKREEEQAAEEERQASNANPVVEPRANDNDSSSSSSSESSEDSDEEDAVTAMNRLGAMVEAEEEKRRRASRYGWFV